MSSTTQTANGFSNTRRRTPGCLSRLIRGVKWIGIVLIILVAAGVILQLVSTEADKRSYSPRGQLYTVNGRQMHLYCIGQGSPTVILEAGGISYSSEWYWVQQQLSASHRVCAYDRAGMGWSEPNSVPRDGVQLARELHTLLEQAGEAKPYVLAGHSYGGVLNRIYAREYPDEVTGIVLVDSAILLPEAFQNQGEFDQWKRENDILQAFLWGTVRLGIYRLIIGGEMRSFGYPEDVASELVALRASNQAFDTYYAEGILMRRELTEQAKEAEQLGALALAVLWATDRPPLPASDNDRLNALQQAVGDFSSNSVVRFIDGANHGSIIGNEQYAQQVSDSVLEVIESAQTGEPLS